MLRLSEVAVSDGELKPHFVRYRRRSTVYSTTTPFQNTTWPLILAAHSLGPG